MRRPIRFSRRFEVAAAMRRREPMLAQRAPAGRLSFADAEA